MKKTSGMFIRLKSKKKIQLPLNGKPFSLSLAEELSFRGFDSRARRRGFLRSFCPSFYSHTHTKMNTNEQKKNIKIFPVVDAPFTGLLPSFSPICREIATMTWTFLLFLFCFSIENESVGLQGRS